MLAGSIEPRARTLAPRAHRCVAIMALAAAAALAGCGGSADAPPPIAGAAPPASSPGTTQAPPAVTQQPSSACVVAPGVATFSASASADPVAAVQWQRSPDLGASWTPIAGATSTTYSTPATAIGDDNTQFRAVFVNAAGAATTIGVTLNVMSPAPSNLAVIAGNAGGPGDLDGCGAAARFRNPQGVAVDSLGNVYVADTDNQVIRKITTANGVATLAGRIGVRGSSDGTRSTATFSDPIGIAVDPAGNVYVADSTGPTIRKITPAGVVSTLAGSAGNPGSGNGTGAGATFVSPQGLTIDADGNLYVVDQGSFAVRKVTAAGAVSDFAALATSSLGQLIGFGIARDGAGNIFVGGLRGPEDDDGDITYDEAEVWRFKPTGQFDRILAGAAPGSGDGNGVAARLDYPRGLAADAAGNVYVADYCNNEIRKITPAADVTTIAGTVPAYLCNSAPSSIDGVGAAASFSEPAGVAIDLAGNVVVADSAGNVIRRIAADRSVTTIAGTASVMGFADGVGSQASFWDFNDGGYHGYSAIDAAGNVFVTDVLNHTIRKVAPDGTVTTFAGAPPGPDGNYFVGDGVGTAAGFSLVEGITIDAAGNLFAVDFDSNDVRKITPAAVVTTVARNITTSLPWAIAVDPSSGDLFVTDLFGNSISRVTQAGAVSIFAGASFTSGSADGNALQARFKLPEGIAADASGNLYVADTGNNTIRKITPNGIVSTLAGTAGVIGGADGIGAAASFNDPTSLAVDAAGNVYVTDTGNNTVRKIAPDGTTTTIIGNAAQSGVRADSAPRLSLPFGISVRGNTLIVLSAYAVLRYELP